MLLRRNGLMLLGNMFVFYMLVVFIFERRMHDSLLLEVEQGLRTDFHIGILGIAVAALALVGI
jgi:hypothetical protein